MMMTSEFEVYENSNLVLVCNVNSTYALKKLKSLAKNLGYSVKKWDELTVKEKEYYLTRNG